MTRRTLLAPLMTLALAAGNAYAEDAPEGPAAVYQLRTYHAAPEKLEVLLDRFAETNLPLFEEHDITLVGAWTPEEPEDAGDRLVYLVSFPSREAGEEAWKAFLDDPKWQEVFSAEKAEHGEVVTEVEAVYLGPTDYSPSPTAPDVQNPAGEDATQDKDRRIPENRETRLFELRKYTASPGKLDALNARFRDHTLELFAKHGMTNLLYTNPVEGAEGSGETLVYLLAHEDKNMALNSWESFSSDPAWHTARDESQADGVKLAETVERLYLVPTEFSPLK